MTFSATSNVVSLDGTNGFTFEGEGNGDGIGEAVGLTDMNNDGMADVIIGGPVR